MRPRTTLPSNAEDYLSIVARTPDGAKAFNYILRQMCQVLEENPYYSDSLAMARREGRKSIAYDLKTILGEDLFFAILQTKYE